MFTKFGVCVNSDNQASISYARLKLIPWVLSHIFPDYVIRPEHYWLSCMKICSNADSVLTLPFPVDKTVVSALGFEIAEYQGILLQGGKPWLPGKVKGCSDYFQVIINQRDRDILGELRKSLQIFVKDQIEKCDEEVQDILCRLHTLELNTPRKCDTSQMQALQDTLLKLTRLMPLVRPADRELQLSKMKILEDEIESIQKRLATQKELIDVAFTAKSKLLQQLESTRSEKQELEDQFKLILIKDTEGPSATVNDRILAALSMRTSSILAESNTRWTKYS